MKISAVIFDWDGVIVDTMSAIVRGIQETAESYGVKIGTEDILAKYFQPRLSFYKSIGVTADDTDELNRRHAEAIEKHAAPAIVFPEVRTVLGELKKRGVRLGIATNRDSTDILKEIKRLHLDEFFLSEFVRGDNMGKEEKLGELREKFGVDGDQLLFVGDLPSDITAAKTARIRSAGIARTEVARGRLTAEHPDTILLSLLELPSYI